MPGKIILHVLVVGFHHKKGCQLEYSYPPISEGQPHDSSELPEAWKNLPNLALPDGSHNYDSDYIYFILPSADGGKESVYGISCYRQIDALELENRTPDITRGSVQKSVVVLSSLPLFGALRTRLELITHAYFEGKDFSKVDLLADTYTSLTNCMTPSALDSQINCDLSVRELLLTYKHDLLVLFKLMLLERRVVMFNSPASELTSRMLALVSLMPGFLKSGGLRYATHIGPMELSSVDSFVNIRTSGPSPTSSPNKTLATTATVANQPAITNTAAPDLDSDSEVPLNLDSARLEIRSSAVTSGENSPSGRSNSPAEMKDQIDEAAASTRRMRAFKSLTTNMSAAGSFLRVKLASAASTASSAVTSVASRTRGTAAPADDQVQQSGSSQNLATMDEQQSTGMAGDVSKFLDPRTEVDEFGLPLPVFAESNIFLPYVSLYNLDILENPAVRAYFLGANNMLYMQKKHLVDCFIGSTGSEMWLNDAELKRAVQLTSADLRFIDCLLNTVTATVPRSNSTNLEDQQQQEDVFENTDWDGSDEWLRLQFREYLLSLLKVASASDGSNSTSPSATHQALHAQTSSPGDEPAAPADPASAPSVIDESSTANGISTDAAAEPGSAENGGDQRSGNATSPGDNATVAVGHPGDFGTAYLRMLRTTRHYRVWRSKLAEYTGFAEVPSVHPAHGQWKLDDLQLRINHLLSHSEQGRKINTAVQNTGKIVQETGKAMGSAITNARSAVSSLWTGISKTAASRFTRAGTAGAGGDEGKVDEATDPNKPLDASEEASESVVTGVLLAGDSELVAGGDGSSNVIIS